MRLFVNKIIITINKIIIIITDKDMAHIERYPNQLRFLRNKNVKNTADVFKSMFSEYIQINGVDVIYFRRGLRFFNEDKTKIKADPVYGEDPTAEYTVKASLVVFMEILADAYLLNRFGIQNESEVQIYIGIHDFIETFKPLIGDVVQRNYEVNLKANIGAEEIVGTLDTPEIYGEVYGMLPDHYDGNTTMIMTGLKFRSKPRPKNSKFKNSMAYFDVPAEISDFSANITINYDKETIVGLASGSISHRKNSNEFQKTECNMRPQPGDLFQLDNEQLPDCYEVVRVIDRQYQSTAYNPMLDKYAYICSCVRHVPSHERMSEDVQILPGAEDSIFNPPEGLFDMTLEEPQTTDKSESGSGLQEYADGQFNYSDSDDKDDAYGGYR